MWRKIHLVDLNYKTNLIFPTPIHQFDVNGFDEIQNELIDYAYNLKEKEPEGALVSNRGGWQSLGFEIEDYKLVNPDYKNIIVGNKSGGLTYYNSDSLLTNTNNFANSELMLYPNPTKNNITIVSNTLGNVELYNTHGILILQKTKRSDKLIISLKKVSNGIYYLKFNNKTNLVVKL